MSVRLRRGSLTAATVGAAAYLDDYERCLQLGGTDLSDDELITTLLAVVGYYNVRADLDRCVTILESLRAGLGSGRAWFRYVIDANFAIVDWLRGEFDSAATGLAEATAGMAATEPHRVDAVRHSDTIVAAHLHMACIHAVRGDLMEAEAELAQANRRVEELGFPRAPFVRAHALSIGCMVCAETGRLPEAKALATDILQLSERHGLETSRLTGTTQLVAVRALMTLNDTRPDQARLSEHIAALTASLDERTVRGVNLYRTYFDAVLARLLNAAGDPKGARHRLDWALRLADDTGMHFYDAELLRLRAHTHADAARARPISPPRATSPVVRVHRCTNCVPRSTTSTSEARLRMRRSPMRSVDCPPIARYLNVSVQCSCCQQSRPENIQRQSAEIQCAAVEFLQGHAAAEHLVAQLLPDPLPDRVRRRLARPAQVAVQLEP